MSFSNWTRGVHVQVDALTLIEIVSIRITCINASRCALSTTKIVLHVALDRFEIFRSSLARDFHFACGRRSIPNTTGAHECLCVDDL